MCVVSGCTVYTPVVFLEFQKTEITTISQMMQAAMSSNSFAFVKLVIANLKMKTLPAGFPVALCSTAIQLSDRHSTRSFLSLRIADFVVDVADVLDVSVSEIDAFPPGEHLAFLRHCFQCIDKFWSLSNRHLRPISIQTKNPMFGVLQPFSSRSCIVLSFKSDAIRKDFFFVNIVLRQ